MRVPEHSKIPREGIAYKWHTLTNDLLVQTFVGDVCNIKILSDDADKITNCYEELKRLIKINDLVAYKSMTIWYESPQSSNILIEFSDNAQFLAFIKVVCL